MDNDGQYITCSDRFRLLLLVDKCLLDMIEQQAKIWHATPREMAFDVTPPCFHHVNKKNEMQENNS